MASGSDPCDDQGPTTPAEATPHRTSSSGSSAATRAASLRVRKWRNTAFMSAASAPARGGGAPRAGGGAPTNCQPARASRLGVRRRSTVSPLAVVAMGHDRAARRSHALAPARGCSPRRASAASPRSRSSAARSHAPRGCAPSRGRTRRAAASRHTRRAAHRCRRAPPRRDPRRGRSRRRRRRRRTRRRPSGEARARGAACRPPTAATARACESVKKRGAMGRRWESRAKCEGRSWRRRSRGGVEASRCSICPREVRNTSVTATTHTRVVAERATSFAPSRAVAPLHRSIPPRDLAPFFCRVRHLLSPRGTSARTPR